MRDPYRVIDFDGKSTRKGIAIWKLSKVLEKQIR